MSGAEGGGVGEKMRARASYDEPFAWWGPVWTPPAARSAADLVSEGTLAPATAGLLAALLGRRASLVVAAEASGAGKTTLLTALLAFYPPNTRRLYLRGCYEPFAFLDDPTLDPTASLLLVNEISAHLPAYLWGPAVGRTLEATRRGFALAATAHAADPTDLVRLLAGYPLRVPLHDVAAVKLVVLLDAWSAGDKTHREVASVTALLPPVGAGGLTLVPLA
ncbi:MAG: CpaF/VirB11 family protein, partial [Chloroflexota bacterium]|nr:CpaF/VirB11 family protein [Chloroflexota bacterium]